MNMSQSKISISYPPIITITNVIWRRKHSNSKHMIHLANRGLDYWISPISGVFSEFRLWVHLGINWSNKPKKRKNQKKFFFQKSINRRLRKITSTWFQFKQTNWNKKTLERKESNSRYRKSHSKEKKQLRKSRVVEDSVWGQVENTWSWDARKNRQGWEEGELSVYGRKM